VESFLRRLADIWRPHAGQLRFLLAQAPNKVLACGRRWGKTDACAVEILSKLVLVPPSRSLIVAPTLDQARLVFERVAEFIERGRVRLGLGAETVRNSPFPVLRVGDSRVAARSGHRPRSLRGDEATHILVDEAAFLPDRVIDEVLSPMLATTAGTLTLASTPNGFNAFWRRFRRGEEGDGTTWAAQAPTAENPFVRPEFLEGQRLLVSQRTYAVEYEASFEAGEGQVFPPTTIEEAICPSMAEARGPISIGVDWGRHEDYTAVCVVQGHRERAWLVESSRFRRLPRWESLIARVATLTERYLEAAVRCDTTGMQDSLLERLRDALPRHSVSGFDFGGGRKAGLIDRLASQFDRRALFIPPDPVLREELLSFTARRTASGNMRLEAGSGHDDMVAALALAVFDLPSSGGIGVLMGAERSF
jgi:phage FluMu gp28-like protein